MDVIAQHDRYFARLIGLIPTELYLHSETQTGYNAAAESKKAVKMATTTTTTKQEREESAREAMEEDEESGVEVEDDESEEEEEEEEEETQKYTKKGKAPLSADERKVRSQENKKRKYAATEGDEPATSSSAKAESETVSGWDGENTKSMEDLRKKLQERIQQLKVQRQTKKQKPSDAKAAQLKEAKNNANKAARQLKEVIAADVDDASVDSLKNDLADSHFVDDDDLSALSLGTAQRAAAAAGGDEMDLEYTSLLKFDKQKFLAPKESASKKDGGKTKRLQRLLQEAERKRERLKALTTSGDEALKKKARGEQWNDALESAAGGKPLMVSTTGGVSKTELKIKKALKKRDKKKQKSAEEWADRLQKVKDDKNVRLAKRDENLAKKKNRADDAVKSTIVHDEKAGGKKGVAIRKPGEQSKDAGKGNQGNNNAGQKKKNRAGFEGKKSGVLNEK